MNEFDVKALMNVTRTYINVMACWNNARDTLSHIHTIHIMYIATFYAKDDDEWE